MSSRKKKKKGESAASGVLSFSIYLLLIVTAIWLLNSFVITKDVVSGESMEDTLSDGDVLIIDRISYRVKNPRRFDIVVFPCGRDWYIKRIIGMPGETIQIDESGAVYANERLLPDRFGREAILESGIAGGKGITLGKGEYFVMGDNRNHSTDSRAAEIGPVKKQEFIGRAMIRIWPPSRLGSIK
ncbi:MAG: signal peptidase I [Lachnospiraceae bacterium]|nr:signal peptidase I [Lachnospiraceae bacterium]